MVLDENLFEAKTNNFEKISDMIYQALTRLGYLVNADKVGYAITKRINPSKKLVSRQDKDFDFVTDEQLNDAKALLTKANIGYFVKRLLNQPTLYIDLTNFDEDDVNIEALERSIEDRFKGWLRKLYTKKYKDKSDDEIVKAFLAFVKYDANDDEIAELEDILDEFKSNKEKMLTESVADLTSIKIPGYTDTWSAIDVFTTSEPDFTRYFLMENDKYGDETQYLVVSEDLSEVYETYDDIETALRDEGILESLNEDTTNNIYKMFIQAIEEFADEYDLDLDDLTEQNDITPEAGDYYKSTVEDLISFGKEWEGYFGKISHTVLDDIKEMVEEKLDIGEILKKLKDNATEYLNESVIKTSKDKESLKESYSQSVSFWDWANSVARSESTLITPVSKEVDNLLQDGEDEDYINEADLPKLKSIVDEFSYYLYDSKREQNVYAIANGQIYFSYDRVLYMNKKDADYFAKNYNLIVNKVDVNFDDLMVNDTNESFGVGLPESKNESIIKTSKGKWVNKGKEGTHGEFSTKKKAREQQKAMFASGWKGESLEESADRISIEHDFEDITNMSDARERLKKYNIDLIKKDNRNYVLRKDGKEYTFYVLDNPNEVRKDLSKAVHKLVDSNKVKDAEYFIPEDGREPQGLRSRSEIKRAASEFGLKLDDGDDNRPGCWVVGNKQKLIAFIKKYYKDRDADEEIRYIDDSITESKGVIRKYKGYTLHDTGDSITITDPHGKTVATEPSEIAAEGRIDELTKNESFEDKNSDTIQEIGKSELGERQFKYKGYTIVHFPLTMEIEGEEPQHIESYIINSPAVLTNSGYHLPLYPEDENGNYVNFRTLEDAKNWIDKFNGKFKLQWKHGDELHAVIKDDSLDESFEDEHLGIKENIGSDIAEYQKWVDYDIKKYGRISSLTNHKVRKAGLKIVKDKYGDYEVIANEPIREDLEREFTIHYNREGFEFGGYGAVRVKATDEDEAKEKFYAEKKDDKITISSIRPTENEDIRKGIRLLETKKVEESLKNNEVADFFDKAKKLGVKTLKDLKTLLAQPEVKGDSEKEKLDNYSKEANPEDKDLTEDVEVVDKNQTEIDKKVGLENLLNDLINDENEAINGYNSAIVNFELEGKSDLTDVFRDIIKDEQNHIGNLQKVLNEINPTTIANLEQGQQEAADTLNK